MPACLDPAGTPVLLPLLKHIPGLLLTGRDDRDNSASKGNVGKETDLRPNLNRLRQLYKKDDARRREGGGH